MKILLITSILQKMIYMERECLKNCLQMSLVTLKIHPSLLKFMMVNDNHSEVEYFPEYPKKLEMPQTYLVFLPEKAKLEKLEELVCKRNERKPYVVNAKN